MSTNITLDNISLNYFKSSDIKVFPCIYRDPLYDKESKLNTERNFTKLGSSGFNSRISYIKEWENNTSDTGILYCNIGGYNIEINTRGYEQLLVSDKASYLILKLDRTQIAVESGGNNVTYTYRIGALDSENSSVFLDHIKADEISYFTGLGYFTVDQDSDVSGLEITTEDNPSAEYLYYLLQIGSNGSKFTESFLPEIRTSSRGGIAVPWMDTFDENNNQNTGEWLAHHLVNTSGGYFIGSTITEDKQKVSLSLNLQTSEVDGVLMPDAERMEYYQVQGIYADASQERSILGVKIPAQTWRPIKVDGETLLGDNTGSHYNLNLKAGNNTTLSTDNGEIEISTTDSYHRRIYSSGLQISTPVGDNLSSNEGIFIPKANADTLGAVKVAKIWDSEAAYVLACDKLSDMPEKRYGIESDSTGKLFVHIPWIDHTNQINKLQTEIEILKDKLAGGTTTTMIPWATEPVMEMYDSNSSAFIEGSFEDFSEGRQNCFLPIFAGEDVPASDLEDLAGYKLKIYPNVVVGASILNESDISIKDSNGFFEFKATSNSYKSTQLYKEFSISPTEKAVTGAISVGNINVSITYSGNNISPKVYKSSFKMQTKIKNKSVGTELYNPHPYVELFYHETEKWPETPLKLVGNGEALRLRVYHNKVAAENVSIAAITPYIPIKLDGVNYSKRIFNPVERYKGSEYWEYNLQFIDDINPWEAVGEYEFEPYALIVYQVTDQNGNTAQKPIEANSSVYKGTSGMDIPDVFWANTSPSFAVRVGNLVLKSDHDFTIENNTATYNTIIGNTPDDVKNFIFVVPQPKTGVQLACGSGTAGEENINITCENYTDWMAYGYNINDTNAYAAGIDYSVTYTFKIKYEHIIYTEETRDYTYKIKLKFKKPGGSGNTD